MIRKMRKSYLLVIGALLLVLTGTATQSEAGVNVNIGINLPAIRFAAPPAVVVIPGTYVYMVPDIDVDVLFFQGYWWRPYEGHWYRSRDYKGRWRYVEPREDSRWIERTATGLSSSSLAWIRTDTPQRRAKELEEMGEGKTLGQAGRARPRAAW